MSALIIKNSILMNFTKALIYLDFGSNLLIENCDFSNLIATTHKISGFFECKQCENVILQNNNFYQCSNLYGSCLVLRLGKITYKLFE